MLIILLNIGLLIMAAIALWQQKSKKSQMDRQSIVGWLKTVSFLVVVMGMTWIMGVLVLEVDALYPVAYIFTIAIAFQGLAIFLSLVVFQKSIRDEYMKCCLKQTNKLTSSFEASSTAKVTVSCSESHSLCYELRHPCL